MKNQSVILLISLFILTFCVSKKKDVEIINSTKINKEKKNNHFTISQPVRYKGNTPCTDCESIDYELTLYTDYTAKNIKTYNGKNFSKINEGKWFVNDKGNLVLSYTHGEKEFFEFINDNNIVLLNQDESILKNDSYDKYILEKSVNSFVDIRFDDIFILDELMGNITIPIADKSHPTLIFNKNNDKFTGFAGCNNVAGSYSINDNNIKFKAISTTRKACSDDDYEAKFISALNRATNFEFIDDGNILYIYNNTEIVIKFHKMRK